MAAVAAAVPKVTITVEEIDEESHLSHILLTFTEGRLESKKFGRTLAPGEFDSATVSHCINLLEQASMQGAARFLKEQNIVV